MPKSWRSQTTWRTAGCLLLSVMLGCEQTAAQDAATVDVEIVYTGELAANVRGGLDRGAVGMGNLDALLRADLGSLVGWEGASALIYGLANHGGAVTELTGDAQAVSNIEAPGTVRLYEAWIQQNWTGPDLSLLAGLYDVNSEFDVVEVSGVFLNSSFGIGAEFASSGLNGPSIFPVTSLAIRLQWHPTHRWYAQGALLDGVPGDPKAPTATVVRLSADEGALWVAEVGYLHHRDPSREQGEAGLGRGHGHEGISWRVAAGSWQYSREHARADGAGTLRARPGAYLLAEARPYREARGGRETDQGLGVAARVGFADERANRFASFTAVSLTYRGAIPGRDSDLLGLGLATARNGDAFRDGAQEEGRTTSAAETTVEITYRAEIATGFVLQPDVQLVIDPGTDPSLDNALVFALRAEIGF